MDASPKLQASVSPQCYHSVADVGGSRRDVNTGTCRTLVTRQRLRRAHPTHPRQLRPSAPVRSSHSRCFFPSARAVSFSHRSPTCSWRLAGCWVLGGESNRCALLATGLRPPASEPRGGKGAKAEELRLVALWSFIGALKCKFASVAPVGGSGGGGRD